MVLALGLEEAKGQQGNGVSGVQLDMSIYAWPFHLCAAATCNPGPPPVTLELNKTCRLVRMREGKDLPRAVMNVTAAYPATPTASPLCPESPSQRSGCPASLPAASL